VVDPKSAHIGLVAQRAKAAKGTVLPLETILASGRAGVLEDDHAVDDLGGGFPFKRWAAALSDPGGDVRNFLTSFGSAHGRMAAAFRP
jgi:hypothetical protein